MIAFELFKARRQAAKARREHEKCLTAYLRAEALYMVARGNVVLAGDVLRMVERRHARSKDAASNLEV